MHYPVEYFIFEDASQLPELLTKQMHVAYAVDNAEPYIADADRIIYGPEKISDTVRIVFVIKDDVIFALYEDRHFPLSAIPGDKRLHSGSGLKHSHAYCTWDDDP